MRNTSILFVILTLSGDGNGSIALSVAVGSITMSSIER